MNKYKYLAKNMGFLTISNFGTKILSFFLVPLYTSILTTEEYGTYDLFNTTIGILVPFLTLNVMDSILRFSIDEDSDRIGIITIGYRIFVLGFIPLLAMTIANYVFGFIPILRDYAIQFLLLYFFTALMGIMTSFARGIDRIADLSISGVLCTAIMIGFNVLFLVIFKWGILGYFWANIFGVAIQSIYLFIRTKTWKYIKLDYKNLSMQKEMLSYSKPLIANTVAWWVNSASDRYIVTWLCGMAENGIYSVGYKIPSILNIFQTIFSQAWTLSAVHDFDPEDNNGFFSKIYNFYNFGMTVICSFLIISARILARLLYAKDFFSAWRYVPFLMIAIVFGSMSGYIGGIFSAIKNSKIYARSTVIGALVNLCLNVILVHVLGALGAAIATAISYWIVWVIRVIHMKRYLKIKLFLIRDYIAYFILVVQSIILLVFTQESIGLYLLEVALLMINITLFHDEIKSLKNIVLAKMKVRFTLFR